MKTVPEAKYSSREMTTIAQADHVVAKIWISGEWHEQMFYPEPKETLYECLTRVHGASRHLRETVQERFVVYLATADDRRACIPEFVPVDVREALGDR